MTSSNPASQAWVTRLPAPRLRPFIDRYIGYRLVNFPPGVHRGLPSRHMTFIASIGRGIDVVSQTDPTQGPRSYRSVLSGLQATAALIQHDGNQEGVAIELTPLGSRTLFGMPARELWHQSHELADVVGGRGAELWERLQGADTWDSRFQICDAVLERLASAHDHGVVAPELRYCWTTLVSTNGKVQVAELASEVGYSRQHLAQRFRDEFGLTPKLAGRIVRFEAARRMLQSLPSFVSTAQVATACGYYDQAHLYRDFAELAGCTPRELLGEELPNFQDSGTAGG